jgi:hypothetical protein
MSRRREGYELGFGIMEGIMGFFTTCGCVAVLGLVLGFGIPAAVVYYYDHQSNANDSPSPTAVQDPPQR